MSRYLVGIDLGTSNTVVAYAAAGEDEIRLLPIDQLVGPGEVAALPLLPSVRYHPAVGELDPASLRLPWASADGDATAPVIGRYARDLGAQVPGRLVTSAKSWLSHAGVDRSVEQVVSADDVGAHRLHREELARRDLFQRSGMEHIICAIHDISHGVQIADVPNVELNLPRIIRILGLQSVSHPVLLLLVAAYYADFADIRGQEMFKYS